MSNVSRIFSNDGLNVAKKARGPKSPSGKEFWGVLEEQIGVKPQKDGRDARSQFALPVATLRPLTRRDMIAPIKGGVMPLKPLQESPRPLKPLTASAFDGSMSKEPQTQHEKLQETARKLVAQTFFGPMLKTMRESPFKDKLFSGGRGGEAFTSMLDQRLAEHMARSSDSKLVRAITRKLEAKASNQAKVTGKLDAAESSPNQNVRNHVAPGLRA